MKFVIIDGNAIIHRAYHALPPLTTKEGIMVNAVYGFTSMLLKVIKELKPTHLAVTFDVAGPTFRHQEYTAYKATRVKADQALYDQIPLTYEVVKALGIPIYTKQGFEADDVIGTVVEQLKTQGPETFVVTGDMDTFQLINDHTKVYYLKRGLADTEVYDAAAVERRFGFPPERLVDYKAIRGDVSDNIPGVPGIGEKGATELIQKFGGLEEIYSQLHDPQSSIRTAIRAGVIKKLEAGEALGQLSYKLALIDRQVPGLEFKLADCLLKPLNRSQVLPLFQRFEFTSLVKRLPGAAAETSDPAVPPNRQTKTGSAAPKFVFNEITTATELDAFRETVKKEKRFACQAVTSGADVFSGKLTGLVMAVGHRGIFVSAAAPLFKKMLAVFAVPEYELAGHNLKQLLKWLTTAGEITVKNKLSDVMVASYLLNPGSRAHDAGSIVLKTLGIELMAGSGQTNLFGAEPRQLAEELRQVAVAGERLRDELATIDTRQVLEKIELPLIPVLAAMELQGVAVDTKHLARLSAEVQKQIAAVETKIYRQAGGEFNIASPVQLREILFDKLQIPTFGIKKGKTGLSTAAEQLEKMRGLHPIIDEIEKFRELAKLQNTYTDTLPTLVNPVTKRLHTTFNQTVTATGRLSSSEPNLQNIPIRTPLGRRIRVAFVAPRGCRLVSADYSQIELRVAASLAGDERMIEIFRRGADIHTATAAAINGVAPATVTKDLRRAAKEINFGILYGMGAYGLSWRAELAPAEARTFIEKYFREFSGLKKFIDQTLAFTRARGFCETLFGRRRYLPEINASNFQLRAAAERMAVNHPIQGTAADIIKLAMVAVYEKLRGATDQEQAKLVLQVHDELVVEVRTDLVGKIKTLLKETMEGVVELKVPVVVDVRVGQNWGELE